MKLYELLLKYIYSSKLKEFYFFLFLQTEKVNEIKIFVQQQRLLLMKKKRISSRRAFYIYIYI